MDTTDSAQTQEPAQESVIDPQRSRQYQVGVNNSPAWAANAEGLPDTDVLPN